MFALVERDGRVSSHHVANVSAKTLREILVTHADRKSYLMTDEAGTYIAVGREFSGHGSVNHSIECRNGVDLQGVCDVERFGQWRDKIG